MTREEEYNNKPMTTQERSVCVRLTCQGRGRVDERGGGVGGITANACIVTYIDPIRLPMIDTPSPPEPPAHGLGVDGI